MAYGFHSLTGIGMKMHKQKENANVETTHIKIQDLTRLRETARGFRQLQKDMEEKQSQIKDLKERYLRTIAEFDNYKKRTDREKQEIYRFGTENLVLKLLPFDEIFEEVIKHMENSPSLESIHKGLEMLKKEFTRLLDGMGVKKIETTGKIFNHEFHEAEESVETNKFEEGTIIQEVRSGYLFHDKILRPALVKVAKRPESRITKNDKDPVPGKD